MIVDPRGAGVPLNFPTSGATCLSSCVVLIGARLVYHPHIFSTMAESTAETSENVARKNANEEKTICFL